MPGGGWDLEAKDDGPDEAEGEALVAVDDVVGAHVLQVNPLLVEEGQGLVHVLQAVDPHLALRRVGLHAATATGSSGNMK